MAYDRTSWQFGIATHTGPVKRVNEDQTFLRFTQDRDGVEIAIVAVADGMGGYQIGDLASQMAIDLVSEWWDQHIPKCLKQGLALEKISEELYLKVFEINKTLFDIRQNKGIKLGTTLSVLLLYKGQYSIVHIGDSRIYKVTGSRLGFQNFFRHQTQQEGEPGGEETEVLEESSDLTQLTDDHSWVNSLVKSGSLTKEEARHHDKRNVLLQCLGINDSIEPHQASGSYHPNDIFYYAVTGFIHVFRMRK